MEIKNSGELSALFEDPLRGIEWLQGKGLLKREQSCPKCSGAMKLKKVTAGDRVKWLCRRKACAATCSIRTASIFYDAKSSLATLTRLFYEWAAKSPVSRAMSETGLSRCAVLEWFRLLRDFLFDFEFDRTSRQIGGAGMTVEVDETKVVRRKYNIGRISSANKEWLVGGICRETGEIFLERVEARTQAVLHELIQRHVAPGTRILSDCWAGYNGLTGLGYDHATVNHSYNFVDPLQGDVHTQRIENVWRWLKHFLKQKGTNIQGSLEGYFAEYMFRKEHENDSADVCPRTHQHPHEQQDNHHHPARIISAIG
ncbi:uncharacterized protein LOC128297888 [Anopheles moucheti]|uniref:uncharacterized protein LOC128297877 n=1 Tax=Anopheles moucheti TaxID=186751 RepID=UPI0022F105E8|nr:uncharacterized protein LOC128297877 [Anopheles moucheti]XP_052889565.1 uncharacterized protein LOC128297888 [Anopheles moucheti]